MLAGKSWKWEAVALLGCGLMLSLTTGVALGQILHWAFPKLSKGTDIFIRFLLSTACFQGVALLLIHQLLRLHEISWRELLGLDQPRWHRAVSLGLATGLIVIPLALLLNFASYEMLRMLLHTEPERQAVVTIVEQSAAWYQRVCYGFAAIVLAPFVEEILFRGILYRLLKERSNGQIAMWISASLFALIHANLMTLAPLIFLAVVLTLVYERTEILLAAISAHAVFNTVNFVLLLYAPEMERVLGVCL